MKKKRKDGWMTLEEALDHIMKVEGCKTREEAFEKLRPHLVNGEIEARGIPVEYPGDEYFR